MPAQLAHLTDIGTRTTPMTIRPPADYLRSVPAIDETGLHADPTVRQLVAAHSAFGTLPEQDRHTLLRFSRIRTLKRLEAICQPGDPATSVLLVLEGFMKVSRPLSDDGEIILELLGAGRSAGELPALQRKAHDTAIVALSPCRLLQIDARQFRQVFERRPDELLAILRLVEERFQIVTDQLADSRDQPAAARLAKALLRLARSPIAGSNSEAGLPMRLSQAELGSMSSLCREFVCRYLGAWRDAGWVKMHGGTVSSIQIVPLTRVSEAEASGGNKSRSRLN